MITKNLYKKILGLFIVIISFCLFVPAVYAEKRQCELDGGGWLVIGLDNSAYRAVISKSNLGNNYTFELIEISNVSCAENDVEGMEYCVTASNEPTHHFSGDDLAQLSADGQIFINNNHSTLRLTLSPIRNVYKVVFKVNGIDINGCENVYTTLYLYYDLSIPAIHIDSPMPTPGNSFANGIKCDNYQSYNKESFEYNFCYDKNKALEANQYIYTFDKNNSTFDQNGVISLKCNWRDTVDSSGLDDKDYYSYNKTYMYGQSIEEISVGSYTYHYYSHTGNISNKEYGVVADPTVVDAKCTVKREEVVVAEYGPPIASKAGLCFQYKVKVTSRVNVESLGDLTPPTIITQVNTPSPICWHGSTDFHQGGPNEDFDECIKVCDGGKYTEKCSLKCYNQVYGSNLVKKMNNLDFNATVERLNNTTCVREYYVRNGLIHWRTCTERNPDADPNTNIGIWLRPHLPGNTGNAVVTANYGVESDPPYYRNKPSWGCPSSGCLSVVSGLNPMNYTENGASQPYYGKNRYSLYSDTGIPKKGNCEDSCYWYSNQHDKFYLNAHDAENDNAANLKIYEELKNKCTASIGCKTTTATFQISVDYVNTANKKMTIYYPYSQNDSASVDRIEFGKVNTLTNSCSPEECTDACTTLINQNKPITANNGNYNGCYQNPNDLNSADNTSNPRIEQRWYQAEWTFAGSWFYKATGLTYYPICNQKPLYVAEKKFCLPLNVKNVNQKWYNYYQNKVNQGGGYSYDDSEYLNNIEKCNTNGSSTIWNNPNYDGSDITYNIHASTRKFGYFEWNIDMECFYAINSNFPASSDDDSSEEVKCLNGKEEYRIRTVDLKNLFPSESGNQPNPSNPEITGRSPGFNWSKYADTTEKDPVFASQPSKYAKWVQKTALNGQSYDDAYLDYFFDLSKSDIAAIKKQNHKYTDFADDDVNYDRTGSVVRYKSSLFRNGGILDNGNNKLPNGDALKCNNMVNWQSSSCQDLEA